MLNSLVKFSTFSSLVDTSSFVNIISAGNLVLLNFVLTLTGAVSNYFATIEVAYLA